MESSFYKLDIKWVHNLGHNIVKSYTIEFRSGVYTRPSHFGEAKVEFDDTFTREVDLVTREIDGTETQKKRKCELPQSESYSVGAWAPTLSSEADHSRKRSKMEVTTFSTGP